MWGKGFSAGTHCRQSWARLWGGRAFGCGTHNLGTGPQVLTRPPWEQAAWWPPAWGWVFGKGNTSPHTPLLLVSNHAALCGQRKLWTSEVAGRWAGTDAGGGAVPGAGTGSLPSLLLQSQVEPGENRMAAISRGLLPPGARDAGCLPGGPGPRDPQSCPFLWWVAQPLPTFGVQAPGPADVASGRGYKLVLHTLAPRQRGVGGGPLCLGSPVSLTAFLKQAHLPWCSEHVSRDTSVNCVQIKSISAG